MTITLLTFTLLTLGQTVDLETFKWNWRSTDGKTTSFIQVRPSGNVFYFSSWTVGDGVAKPEYCTIVVRGWKGAHRGWSFYADGSRGESTWQSIQGGWESDETVYSANGKSNANTKLLVGNNPDTWEFTRSDGGSEIARTYNRVGSTPLPIEPDFSGIPFDRLGAFSLLVGVWGYSHEEPTAERPDTRSWSPWGFWILNGNFAVGWTHQLGDRDSIAITGRDIVDDDLKSWVFRTDGGHEVHAISSGKAKGKWETTFTGVDGNGKEVEGNGSYSTWMKDEPATIHLKYDETRRVAAGRAVNWSVKATRPRIVPNDRMPPTAGQEVLVTDNIPGDGIDEYWLYLPRKHNPQQKWPLIVYLHGASRVGGQLSDIKHLGPIGYASGQMASPKSLSELVRTKFIIINPHLTAEIFRRNQWSDQTEAIDAIVDSLMTKYAVDPHRIYVTGISLGGHGTWAYASRTRHNLAAIVPICGGSWDVEDWSKLDDLAIWVLHNKGDHVVKLKASQEAVEQLEKYGEKFKCLDNAAPRNFDVAKRRLFTVFDKNGHDAWTDTYSHPHVYRWLLNQ